MIKSLRYHGHMRVARNSAFYNVDGNCVLALIGCPRIQHERRRDHLSVRMTEEELGSAKAKGSALHQDITTSIEASCAREQASMAVELAT